MEKLQAINKRIIDLQPTLEDLFDLVDLQGNGNGFVEKEEFKVLLERLEIKFTSARVDEIFKNVKLMGLNP